MIPRSKQGIDQTIPRSKQGIDHGGQIPPQIYFLLIFLWFCGLYKD